MAVAKSKQSGKLRTQIKVLACWVGFALVLIGLARILPSSSQVPLVLALIIGSLIFLMMSLYFQSERSAIPLVDLRKLHFAPFDFTFVYNRKRYRRWKIVKVGSDRWRVLNKIQEEGRWSLIASHWEPKLGVGLEKNLVKYEKVPFGYCLVSFDFSQGSTTIFDDFVQMEERNASQK